MSSLHLRGRSSCMDMMMVVMHVERGYWQIDARWSKGRSGWTSSRLPNLSMRCWSN